MFCRNCQTIIPDDSLFCENCGAPTGLDPDQIDDSNLVPEEAVEYEIVEDEEPVQTVSVPVDPVWWEPPEGEDAPIDVEAEEVFEEPLSAEDDDFAKAGAAGYEAQPESPDEEAAEAAEEDEESFAEETGAKLQDIASGALGLGKTLLEKMGSAGASIIDRIDGDDEESMKATQQWDKAAWDEEEATEESAKPAKPAEEPAEEPVSNETAKPAEEPAPNEPEPEEPSVSTADESAAWFWGTSAGPQKGQEEQPGRETAQEEEQDLIDEGEEAGSDGAEKAKVYAAKAKSWLEDLGKVVHTGTGKAMVAAREQLQQKKEEYEEQREQREQQRAQEKKEKEAEQKRKERERQEQEKQREREMRTEENIIQQPGFWYGDNMPKPTIAIAPAIKADHHPAETEPRESVKEDPSGKEDPSDDEVPEAPDEELNETEPEVEAADAPDGEQIDAGSEAEASDGKQSDEDPSDDEVPEALDEELNETEPEAEAEPEPLSEDFIEDKLANTARFGWSQEDLEAAVAAEAAAVGKSAADASADDASTADVSDPDASPENASETGETAAADSKAQAAEKEEKEEIPPDEPVLYRIQDFGPSKPNKKEKKPFDKSRWKLIAIIAGILMVIALVAGIMIHQAHVKQLEEEAYQAALVQAHQLAEEKKYEDAEALYLKLIDQRPEDTEPYLGLAQMYVDQQRYVDAKALIKGAIEATGNEEAFKEIKKEIKTLTSRKWKKAYIKVLEEYETDIRSYEEDVTASVAVCDINGDLKPELFFFTKEYYGYGKLHIYTTIKNKAKEVNYECENKGTQYHDAFYDVSSSDSSYAIFNEKENEKFAIYANITTDGRSWDTINEYRLNLQGGCRQLRVIQGSIDTNYDENGNSNSTYLQDGEEISYEKYVAEFGRVLDEVKQVILYNGGDGDQAVWSKIKPENVMCMSYDAMMVDLKAK